MKIFRALVFLLFALGYTSYAQDNHFSQFYSAPLALNPALTGNFNGDYRLNAIYRNQWSGINSKFETSALGLDMNFKGGVLNKDIAAAGLYLYRDNLGDIFIAQSIALSGAYHYYLDVYRRHKLSGGIQGTYIQKSIDPSKLTFSDQFEDFVLNEGLQTNDAIIRNKINYFTVNLGMLYSFVVSPKTDVFAGLSVFQVNNPKESFYISSGSNHLNKRYTSYTGMNYKMSEKITLSPKILYMFQVRAQDINVGMEAGYKFPGKQSTTIYAGGWYRLNDAAILIGGTKWKTYTLKFSYDATVSNLKEIKNANNIRTNPKTGAFELSLILTGKLSRSIPDTYTIPCGVY
jgi:type IX secretion system PorP/SprF family membrane protein